MSDFAGRIRQLIVDKVDFNNDDAEAVVEGVAKAALDLDDATDQFESNAAASGDPVAKEEIANALVDLADLADAAGINPDQREKLDSIVARLIPSGDPVTAESLKNVFAKSLDYMNQARGANFFFNNLSQGA